MHVRIQVGVLCLGARLNIGTRGSPKLSTPAALGVRGGGSVRAWRGPDGVGATWTRPAGKTLPITKQVRLKY